MNITNIDADTKNIILNHLTNQEMSTFSKTSKVNLETINKFGEFKEKADGRAKIKNLKDWTFAKIVFAGISIILTSPLIMIAALIFGVANVLINLSGIHNFFNNNSICDVWFSSRYSHISGHFYSFEKGFVFGVEIGSLGSLPYFSYNQEKMKRIKELEEKFNQLNKNEFQKNISYLSGYFKLQLFAHTLSSRKNSNISKINIIQLNFDVQSKILGYLTIKEKSKFYKTSKAAMQLVNKLEVFEKKNEGRIKFQNLKKWERAKVIFSKGCLTLTSPFMALSLTPILLFNMTSDFLGIKISDEYIDKIINLTLKLLPADLLLCLKIL